MQIITNCQILRIKDLNPGDTFLFCGQPYIKTNSDRFNAVNLLEGSLHNFSNIVKVDSIKAVKKEI